jgi:nickel/cobalt exporter
MPFLRIISALGGLHLMPAVLLALQDSESAMREKLVGFLRVTDGGAGFMAVALGVAFLAGAAHALTPGHGKALVAAYLAGSRGTIGDAVYLGTVVTITHTFSIFILGVATLYASQHFLPQKIEFWLEVGSGLLIVSIGSWLLYDRWRSMRGGESAHSHGHSHGPFGWHSHDHGHSQQHSDEHERGDSHEHGHEHGHTHSHEQSHDHSHEHGHSHDHDDAHSHGHSHGHEHAPALPKAGRGSLLSLGISGGLVPCPEALAVLLISFSINRLIFGLVLLTAFTLGLAAVLIAIGIAMVMAGPAMSKLAKDGPLLRILPVASAVIVTLVGVGILYQAAVVGGVL